MGAKKKTSVNLSLDAELWSQTKIIVEEMGFTYSGFVEMMLRRFLQADKVPMGQVIGEILQDVLDAKKKNPGQKRILSSREDHSPS